MSRFAAQLLLVLIALAAGACGALSTSVAQLPPMSFEGAHTFSTDKLREIVAAEVGDVARTEWVRSAVDDGAFAIERFYAGEGFAFAKVEYETVKADDGTNRALFRVEEGPRVALDSIRFDGAKALKREILESYFPKLPRASTSFDDTRADKKHRRHEAPWWVESELESAAGDLEDYYYRNGYLDAHVAPPAYTFDEERRYAIVVIGVSEGVRSQLTRVVIEGAPADLLPALQRAAASFQRMAYSSLLAGAVRAKLEEVLASLGYPDGKAIPGVTEHGEKGETSTTFTIEAGPRVTISAIEIRGTKRTLRRTVLGMLKLDAGDVYSSDKVRESFRALYQSGIFSAVQVGLAPGTDPERVLVVELKEDSASEFYVEPGYGSYERFRLGAGWRYKNLFGTGRSVELDGTISELAQSGRISLVTPRFFGSDFRATTSVFASRREEPSFTSNDTGFGWILSRRLNRRLSANLGYQFRHSSASNIDVTGPQLPDLTDKVQISSIALTPVYDTRDSVFVPTDGSISKATFEFADAAIGSELDFLRLRLAYSDYHELWKDSVLALSWRGGVIAPIHSTSDIPLQERFFNGGENTVRSFREDQLGPTDSQGNPVGGETFQVFSAELRQRLVGNLEGALFLDAGNVQLQAADFFEASGFREGYGVGLRYVLPIGPIRLDYGINPDPHQGESSYVLHFTVGMAF